MTLKCGVKMIFSYDYYGYNLTVENIKNKLFIFNIK